MREARLARSLENALAEGSAAYESGDYAAALRSLSFYVGRRREHDAVFMLADSRRHVPQENRRHIPAAITFARVAIDLDPSSVRAHQLLLELYQESGYATEAGSTADAILALQPGHRGALEARMSAHARLGRFDQALATAQELARDHPDEVDSHRHVAHLMQLNDRPIAEIREYLEQSAERAASNVGFAILYAEAAMLTGDAEDAFARIQTAIELPITSSDQLARLLRLLDTLALSVPQARTLATTVMEATFPDELSREVAVVSAERAWKAGRNDLAWQHIQKAVDPASSLSEVPAAALGWWVLLQQSSATEDESLQAELERKREALRERATNPASDASFWIAIVEGSRALDAGDLQLAAEKLENASSSEGNMAIAGFLLGHLERRKGEWRRAAERWESLIRQNPNWRALRNVTVSLLIDNGQYEEALNRSRESLGWSAGQAEALQFCRATMAFLESRTVEPALATQLLTDLESIAQQVPNDGAIQTCAARAYLAAGRIDPATRAVQRILDPESSRPPSDLVAPLSIALRSQHPELASKLLDLAEQSPASPDAIYARALSLLEQGSESEGLEQARALLDQHIASADARERLAYQFRLYRFLLHTNDPTALSYLASLASEHDRIPAIQTALLDNDAAWETEALITAAVQRLREAAGSDSAAWRIFEARRLLTFTPSQARAAEAVNVLSPFLRRGASDAASRTPMALALAGEAYLLLDDRNRAIDLFERTVDSDASQPNFYPRLIELLQSAGRSEAASRRLTAFARIEPIQPEYRRLRAQLALTQGVWDLAQSDFAALAAAPTALPEDRFGLATAHLRRGQRERAAAILDDLAKLPQATPAMLIAAADMRASASSPARQSDINAGREMLESAPADLPPQLRQALIAAYLQRHGQSGDAEVLLRAAATDDQPDAIAELARFYMDAGRLEESQQEIARGLARAPDNSALRRISALLRIQQGESTAKAWTELAQAMTAWPDAPAALRSLTNIMQQNAANPQDTAGHLARIQQLTRQHPTFYVASQIYIQALSEAGELRRASEAALAAARAMPTDPRPAQLAATALIQERRYEDALAAAAQWRSRAPSDTFDADVVAAWLSQQVNRPQEGLRLLGPWRERLTTNPDPERLTLFAGLLIDVGRPSDASRLLFPHAQESQAWALQYLGLTSRIQDLPAARDWLTRVQPVLAVDAQGRLIMGEAWFQLVSRSRSQADLQQTQSLLSELTSDSELGYTAHALLAGAHDALGNRTETEHHYRAALAVRPDDIVVLNNLAYHLAQDPGQAAEAVQFATRAVAAARSQSASAPVMRAILDTQGIAFLIAERWSEAETTFREALALEPNAPDLLIGLAEARFGQADRNEATTLLQRARSLITPENPLAPTREARLQALEERTAR